jgi:3-methylcrotonyl-CoA carboxylase alpha subunit
MFINYQHDGLVYNVTVERRNENYFVTYDNTEYKVTAEELQPGHLQILLGGRMIKSIVTQGEKEKFIFIDGDVFKVIPVELTGRKKLAEHESRQHDLDSPISGKIVSIKVKKGEKVKRGEVLIVIEAMKMEYLIRAPYDGVIAKVHFKEKDQIEIGQTTLDMAQTIKEAT